MRCECNQGRNGPCWCQHRIDDDPPWIGFACSLAALAGLVLTVFFAWRLLSWVYQWMTN